MKTLRLLESMRDVPRAAWDALVALLCSDLASWITGACIDVDGGWVKSMT